MAAHAGPNLVTGSMSLYVDAGSRRSLTTIAGGWADITGINNNMSFTGATFSAVNGGIVTFAGTPGSSASVPFTMSAEMTWDVWFKRNSSVGAVGSYFNMVFENDGYPYLSFGGSTLSTINRFFFSWPTILLGNTTQNSISPAVDYSDNTWYNVTCTLSYNLTAQTSTAKMYVNGTLVAQNTTAANSNDVIPTRNTMRLATYSAQGPFPFNGSISNLRVYRRVLTDAEIMQNYNAMAPRFRSDVAELAALHIDAANRNSFTRVEDGWSDLSTLRPTLTLAGATYESANGGIITFAGTTGSSSSRAFTTFNQSTEMTWDVWFKRTESPANGDGTNFHMVFEHGNTPYLSFGTSLDPNRLLFSWYTRFGTGTPPGGTQSQRTVSTPSIYGNNIWYNVTCTLKLDNVQTTSTGRIYVNGVLASSATTAVGSSDQIWPNSTTLRLATWPSTGTYPFKGSISNLRIYNRILTDAEILQSYNALRPRFYP